MAVTAQQSVASLMRKSLDRREAVLRLKFRFKTNQVEQILLSYVKDRNVGPYTKLLTVLRDYPINDDNYTIIFEDSLKCVILLGRQCEQYIELVCSIDWASRSEELVQLYNKFILNLVTAHNYHSQIILTCLMKLFKADGENWDTCPPPETLKKWSNVHTIIAKIVATIPMSSDLLMQALIDQFPYYKAGTYINRSYIYNLIWISKYIPLLREQIIMVIIRRMVVMDANTVDLTKNKAQTDAMYEMDVDKENVVLETLDYCMLEILNWLEEEREPALNIICNVFETVILPTHGLRHVQFLVLYTMSISQQCADRILNNLWMVASGQHGLGPGALATKRTAASHLAGLLARCVRVPNSRLTLYLQNMAEWCHSYINATKESNTVSDNTKVHGAFHAICHAIFYLVAFKNHHLFRNKKNLLFVESLNLARLVTCALNPLRTCPPQVTHAFSSVTRSHQVVYCQAIIEKNARHSLQADTHQRYDEWFPYDPYTLPKSGKVVWPLCVEYKDFLKGDSESQYSNMKRKLEEDDDYFMVATPAQKRLVNSLSNSISPGFLTTDAIMM